MAKTKLSPATAAPKLLLSKPLKTTKIISRTNHPNQHHSRKSRRNQPIQAKTSQATRSRHRSSLPSLTIKTSLTIRHRSSHRLLPNQLNRLSQRHLPSRASPTQSRTHLIHHQSQRLQLIQRLQTSSPRQQSPQIPTPRLPTTETNTVNSPSNNASAPNQLPKTGISELAGLAGTGSLGYALYAYIVSRKNR